MLDEKDIQIKLLKLYKWAFYLACKELYLEQLRCLDGKVSHLKSTTEWMKYILRKAREDE